MVRLLRQALRPSLTPQHVQTRLPAAASQSGSYTRGACGTRCGRQATSASARRGVRPQNRGGNRAVVSRADCGGPGPILAARVRPLRNRGSAAERTGPEDRRADDDDGIRSRLVSVCARIRHHDYSRAVDSRAAGRPGAYPPRDACYEGVAPATDTGARSPAAPRNRRRSLKCFDSGCGVPLPARDAKGRTLLCKTVYGTTTMGARQKVALAASGSSTLTCTS